MTEKSTGRAIRGGWPVALLMWAVYTAGMVVLLSLATHPYVDAHLLMAEVWWIVAILAGLALIIAWWSGLRIQWSLRFTWFSLLLIVPVLVSLGGLGYSLTLGGADWRILGFVLLGTLLVGIGEEVAFRGVALNAIGQRSTVIWAVVGSSALFGLMHLANLVSSDVSDVVPQVVLTFLVGLLFGWTYVSTRGNLVLLIVLHWLYDASVIAGPATDFGANWMGSIPALAVALLGIIAMVVMGIRYRGRRLAEVFSA